MGVRSGCRSEALALGVLLSLSGAVANGARESQASAHAPVRLVDERGRLVAAAHVAPLRFRTPFQSARELAQPWTVASPAPIVLTGAIVLQVPALLKVDSLGRPSCRLLVPAGSGPTRTTEVPEGRWLAGLVRTTTGVPLAGIDVVVEPHGPSDAACSPLPARTKTNRDGSFRVLASRGPVRVTARGLGYRAQRRDVLSGGTVGFAIEPAAGLVGTIVQRGSATVVRYEDAEGVGPWVVADGSGFVLEGGVRAGGLLRALDERGFVGTARVPPEFTRSTVAVELKPPEILIVRVHDQDDRPVPGALVELGAGDDVVSATSGSNGEARLPKLFDTARTFVTASAPRHQRQTVSIHDADSNSARVLLMRSATVRGLVIDGLGRPVPEAAGSVEPVTTRYDREAQGASDSSRARRFVTDTNGRFEVEDVYEGTPMRFRIVARGYRPFETDAVVGSDPLELLVKLQEGSGIRGKVADSEGRPIVGARVDAQRYMRTRSVTSTAQILSLEDLDDPAVAMRRGRTDSAGAFAIHGLAPGEYVVRVVADGHAAAAEGVLVGEDALVHDVVLHPAARISGRVVGAAVGSGVRIRAVPTGDGSPVLEGSSDGATFSIDGAMPMVPYDISTIDLSRPLALRTATKRLTGVFAPAEELEIHIEETGTITGTASFGDGSRPGVPLDVAYCHPSMPFRDRAYCQMSSFWDAAGRFEVTGVPPGRWTVVIRANHARPAEMKHVEVRPGETTDLGQLHLVRGTRLSGVVVDAVDRHPVSGASVWAANPGDIAAAMGLLTLQPPNTATGVDGEFEIEDQAPGPVAIVVQHPRYAQSRGSAVVSERGERVEVSLQRGASVTGTVLVEGTPAAGAPVTIERVSNSMQFLGLATAVERRTDTAGRFQFDGIAEGRYRLAGEFEGRPTQGVDIVVSSSDVPGIVLKVLHGARIRGEVTGIAAERRGRIRVAARCVCGVRTTRTAPDGTFSLAGILPGEWELHAAVGDEGDSTRRTSRARLTVVEGAPEVAVTLAFENELSLAGTVTRGGRPESDAQVWLMEQGGRIEGRQVTDMEGRYRFRGLVAGRYLLSAGRRDRPVRAYGWIDLDGSREHDMVLGASNIGGLVVDGSERPLQGVDVELLTEKGVHVGRGISDEAGRFRFDDVSTGRHELIARMRGFAVAREFVQVDASRKTEARIALVAERNVTFRAVDAVTGHSLSAVDVWVFTAAGESLPLGRALPAGDGVFDVPRPAAICRGYLLRAGGYGSVHVRGACDALDGQMMRFRTGGVLALESRDADLIELRDDTGAAWSYAPEAPEGLVRLIKGAATIRDVAPGSYWLFRPGRFNVKVEIQAGLTVKVNLP